MRNKTLAHFSPGRTILISMMFTAFIGTLLLLLPISRTHSIHYLDIIFTATSATCVTGLFTIPLDHLSWFGHCVLMLLMQIGGIGLITMSLFFLSLFVQFGLARQVMAGQLLEVDHTFDITEMLYFIIKYTVTVELIGMAGFLAATYHEPTSVWIWLFNAAFYAISSFCNAGIMPAHAPLSNYNTNLPFLGIIMVLMLIGGLGFLTWHDITTVAKDLIQKKRSRFSLQSKLILYGAGLLIGITSVLFLLLALPTNVYTVPRTYVTALFNAISFRSTGFLLTPLAHMHQAAWWLLLMTAFIGSAPGSTGSGIKTTTIIIIAMLIRSVFLRKDTVFLCGRTIPTDLVYKAVAILILTIVWICMSTFLLLITESQGTPFELLFEVISATSCLGISTGITTGLSAAGKMIIILSMLIGRVGSMSFILAMQFRAPDVSSFSYPEERIMLG